MELTECDNMKIVIMDYEKSEIRIINSSEINFHSLEEDYENDLESYLMEYHMDSNCYYMVTDDLKIMV